MTPDEAMAALRAYADGTSTRPVLTAAAVVLKHAETMEKCARDYLASHPYPGRDEFERGSIVSMQIILGEPLGRA